MTAEPTCYIGPDKKKGRAISDAFAAGGGGAVEVVTGPVPLRRGPAFFYGWSASTLALLQEAQERGNWLYADNAYYFGRGTFFRVTWNAMQATGLGTAPVDRWRRFGVPVLPWQPASRGHVVVASQSDSWHRHHDGLSQSAWADRVMDEIRRHTDRPVIHCAKPAAAEMTKCQAHSSGFEPMLAGAHALVTHSSSAAVKALQAGVPVFTLQRCAATVMGRMDLSLIETPARPDGREQWLANLAASQWTIDEMRDGTCWRDLQRGMAA